MSTGQNPDQNPEKPSQPKGSASVPGSLKPLPPLDMGPPSICQRLEFSARGERVGARVRIPLTQDEACPLAIFIHDEPDDAENPTLIACLENDQAVIDLNWPLTGTRRSHKMSVQLLTVFADRKEDREKSVLFRQFRAQAEEELACLLAAADAIPGIDPRKIHRLDFSLTPRHPAPAEHSPPLFAPTGKTIHHHHGSPGKYVQRASATQLLTEFLNTLPG